jgi:uncharacterized protein YqjF (DUF2071 family)
VGSGGLLEGLQSWRGLLFLHWPVPYAVVRPTVPAALPIDLRDGKAWVSVVAFDIATARPPLVPGGGGLDFLETNARTYVRLPGGEPGVWFFSLDASSRVAVAGARLAYGLPYHHARMARERDGDAEVYRSARRGPEAPGLEVRYRVGDPLGTAIPGSLDAFLVERYALQVARRGGISTVRVRHDPYPLRAVEIDSVSEDLLAAAGIERPDEPPLAHWSDGVDVEVRRVLAWPRIAWPVGALRRTEVGQPARYLSRI